MSTGIAFSILLGFAFWVGQYDAYETWNAAARQFHWSRLQGFWRSLSSELNPRHTASWLTIVVAIVLVSGFVILVVTKLRRTPHTCFTSNGKELWRRILFMALSATLFVAAAKANYDYARLTWYIRASGLFVPLLPLQTTLSGWWWWFLFGASFAVFPLVPLSLSVYSSPFRLRDPWLLMSALLCACSLGFCALRGFRDRGDVHWPWLVSAMSVTLGFMLVGAWRRADVDGPVAASPELAGIGARRDPWLLASAPLSACTLGIYVYWSFCERGFAMDPVSFAILVPLTCATLVFVLFGAWRQTATDALVALSLRPLRPGNTT